MSLLRHVTALVTGIVPLYLNSVPELMICIIFPLDRCLASRGPLVFGPFGGDDCAKDLAVLRLPFSTL